MSTQKKKKLHVQKKKKKIKEKKRRKEANMSKQKQASKKKTNTLETWVEFQRYFWKLISWAFLSHFSFYFKEKFFL